MKRETLIASLAAIACALGVFMTVDSVLRAPQSADVLKRRGQDLERLRALQSERSRDLAAVDMFNRLPTQVALPLADLAAAVMPDNRPSLRPRESRPAAEGWSVRSTEASFDNVKLADLVRFLARAEESRPPWRLIEFHATASEKSPANARVTVLMEALEKK